jgi:hypothetical protein
MKGSERATGQASTNLVPVCRGAGRGVRAVVVRRACCGGGRRLLALERGRARHLLTNGGYVHLGLSGILRPRVRSGAAADERRREPARVPVVEEKVVILVVAAPPETLLDPSREAPGEAGDPGERAGAGAPGDGEERGRRPRGAPPEVGLDEEPHGRLQRVVAPGQAARVGAEAVAAGVAAELQEVTQRERPSRRRRRHRSSFLLPRRVSATECCRCCCYGCQ